MTNWVNDDGLLVRFGSDQGKRDGRAGVTTGAGRERELVLELDLEGVARTLYTDDLDNDGTNDGFSGLSTSIPSGARIVRRDVVILEALAGGTSYTIGTYAANGTAIDADGIQVTAGTVGAQVGTQLAADAHVTAATVGTYTAGKIRVIITYVI